MDKSPMRTIRLSWEEWKQGRSAKRAALSAHGLSGESRRATARPEARQALQTLKAQLRPGVQEFSHHAP